MKNRETKTRNWHAVNAKFRNSAGAMKNKKDRLLEEEDEKELEEFLKKEKEKSNDSR